MYDRIRVRPPLAQSGRAAPTAEIINVGTHVVVGACLRMQRNGMNRETRFRIHANLSARATRGDAAARIALNWLIRHEGLPKQDDRPEPAIATPKANREAPDGR